MCVCVCVCVPGYKYFKGYTYHVCVSGSPQAFPSPVLAAM